MGMASSLSSWYPQDSGRGHMEKTGCTGQRGEPSRRGAGRMGGDSLPPYTPTPEEPSRAGASGVAGQGWSPPAHRDAGSVQESSGELVPRVIYPAAAISTQVLCRGAAHPRGLLAPPLRAAWSRSPAASQTEAEASTYLSGTAPSSASSRLQEPGTWARRAWGRR